MLSLVYHQLLANAQIYENVCKLKIPFGFIINSFIKNLFPLNKLIYLPQGL